MSEVGVWRMRSYAKINLGLHVLKRLDNGYHQIETGMVYIDPKGLLMDIIIQ